MRGSLKHPISRQTRINQAISDQASQENTQSKNHKQDINSKSNHIQFNKVKDYILTLETIKSTHT